MDNIKPHPKIWIISELFYPEDSATGHYMTGIAQWLSKFWNVHVICGQPTYTKRGMKFSVEEIWNGIQISRCRSTILNKDRLPFRLMNSITLSLSIFRKALKEINSGDLILVVTNPPLMPFIALAVCKIKRAQCLLRIDDVYPDAMTVAGVIKNGGLMNRLGDQLARFLLSETNEIIVLGRCMKERITERFEVNTGKITVIPNWSDSNVVFPEPKKNNKLLNKLGIQNRFVVLIAGNIGRVQDIETIAKCANFLCGSSDIHFLFIGNGFKLQWLRKYIDTHNLTNTSLIEHRSRAEQLDFLNACDVALISLKKGMWGVGVPSRFYNHIASGKPIVALIEKESEISRVVREEEIGWVVEPGDIRGLADCLHEAVHDKEKRVKMGIKARKLAEHRFNYETIASQYERLSWKNIEL